MMIPPGGPLRSAPGVRETPGALTLSIANKNYSSWSMRPWLVLKLLGVPFTERVIWLGQADTAARIAEVSPTGQVPVLEIRQGEQTWRVWESLAICDWAARTWPEARLWPEDPVVQAYAISIAAEMHAGFSNLRAYLPLNLRRTAGVKFELNPRCQRDIDRICALWTDARARFGQHGGGPFLFGEFGVADAMFAPVVSRFTSYGVPVPAACKEYMDAMWALRPMQQWRDDAFNEPFSVQQYEK
jgi:glutathione S-transferase